MVKLQSIPSTFSSKAQIDYQNQDQVKSKALRVYALNSFKILLPHILQRPNITAPCLKFKITYVFVQHSLSMKKEHIKKITSKYN